MTKGLRARRHSIHLVNVGKFYFDGFDKNFLQVSPLLTVSRSRSFPVGLKKMERMQHIYFAKPERAQQDSMGWIQDSKKTPLAGKAAVEISMKCQSFTKVALAYHLRTGLWNEWKTLHCGPAALVFLGCLLVEELS